MIYILSILFTLSFVYYSKWQFIEARGGEKGKWHPYGAIMRIIPFIIAFSTPSWQDIVLAGSVNIILFEVGINVIALNKPWDYVGSTAKFDIVLGKKKWIIMAAILLVAVLLRILI